MKKKWPFQVPEEYFSMKITDLREYAWHKSSFLTKRSINYIPTLVWSGSIKAE